MPREDFGYSRTVSYANSNHLAVCFQRWGSVNQKVAPFCVANIALAVGLVFLQTHGIDLSISEFGHEFMSILVAFLVINKLSFTLGLYYELQGYLSTMNQSAIELVQLACAFTEDFHNEKYSEWRHQVTLHSIMLLKAVVHVFHKGGNHNIWEFPDFKDLHLELVVDDHGGRDLEEVTASHRPLPKELYAWGYQLKSDKNLRVPIRVAQRLRSQIVRHKQLPKDPIDTIREGELLQCVQKFMTGYHGVRKYATCPLPLPLVQLGRIFVLFYVFTLPFALLSKELNLMYPQMILLIALMTYGFIGIEVLFVEIDDPFSDDPNDLPLMEESRAAAEDIVLSLMHVDGRDAVEKLRECISLDYLAGKLFDEHGRTGPAKETDRLLQ